MSKHSERTRNLRTVNAECGTRNEGERGKRNGKSKLTTKDAKDQRREAITLAKAHDNAMPSGSLEVAVEVLMSTDRQERHKHGVLIDRVC